MSLLGALFGGDKKTTTQTTTNATSSTTANNAEGQSVTAVNSNVSSDNSVDNSIEYFDQKDQRQYLYQDQSVDYRVTDSRDNSIRYSEDSSVDYNDSSDRSVYYSDSRDLSTIYTDNSVSRSYDNRDLSDNRQSYDYSIRNDVSVDVVRHLLDVQNESDARRTDQLNRLATTTTNAGLDYFSQSAALLRDSYGEAVDAVVANTDKTVAALAAASRTDGQQIAATFEQFGKYAVWIVIGVAGFAALRA